MVKEQVEQVTSNIFSEGRQVDLFTGEKTLENFGVEKTGVKCLRHNDLSFWSYLEYCGHFNEALPFFWVFT